MKTDNLLLNNGQPVKEVTQIWQILVAATGIFIALSPLVFTVSSTTLMWSLSGVIVFALALTGVDALHKWLVNTKLSKEHALNFSEYFKPVIVTKFGKQNSANHGMFKSAA